MTEQMTTDQRVALALTTTLQASAAVTQAFSALVDPDAPPALAKLAQRQVDTQTDTAARILEISEALAAGTLFIATEGTGELVREISRAFREKLIMGHGGPGGEPVSQVREAQLFLARLKDTGVLR